MINQQYNGSKGVYTTSNLLGKGGEGEVYELADHPEQVLKIYSEPLSPIKAGKLQLMVNRFSEQMQAYAAWPTDLVRDKKGKPCGFVMKKLDKFVPLHMLFSPMDRKKIFPDKGYNFLVHVARNIASAFHTLHAAGMVVGDVNEGNLLVNKQGMVAFIDCDSFQLSDGNKYFHCEVGVPRYTPPELLRLSSFENVVRTANTDSFSMAILIFQLLFLGRHPFAGINHTTEDIGEEIAIQRHLFAYSIRNQQKLITPPKDSFDINSLPDIITQLFHDAFESVNRPLPAQWIVATNQLLQQMSTCSRSKLHTFPGKLINCPWCEFREKRNILYFIDDLHAAQSSIHSDFDRFIQGFAVEPVYFPEPDLSIPAQPLATPQHTNRLKKYETQQLIISLILGFAAVLVFIVSTIGGFVVLGLAAFIYMGMPWNWYLQSELKKYKEKHQELSQQLNRAVNSYKSTQDLEQYNQHGKRIVQMIAQYTEVPKNIHIKKRMEEERIYNQQLHAYLQQFKLQDHAIPGFGANRKQALYHAGITSASDISKLGSIKVQGIGPKYEQLLLSWQRQMASGFIYYPDNQQLNKAFLKILDDAAQSKKQLEQEIRSQYNGLQQLKQHILMKRKQLQSQITGISLQVAEAHAELHSFKQLIKVI
jgi:DNA-binding helix-hairpin-helix protein with protein kinase domain